tara:strand:+ start:14262 stop:15980 length:1719 start_codon:yes stop_codon:yes gene_type:complete
MPQIKRIFYLLNKKEKLNFFILIFLMVVNSFFEVLGITSIIPIISITINSDMSFFEGMFFYDFLNDFSQSRDFVLLSFLFVATIFVLKNSFIIFYSYFLSKFHCETAERFSNDIYSYYLNIDYKNYLNLSTSKLIYDTTEAVEIFRITLLNACNFLLEITVLLIITLFLIYLNPTSTIAVLMVLGILSVFFYIFFVKQNFYWGSEVKKNSTNRINVLNTSYSSIKDVKIYSGENFFYKKFKTLNNFVNKYQKTHLFFISLPKPFFEALIIIILLTTLYYFIKIENAGYDMIILNLAVFAVSLFRIYPSIYRIAVCFQKGNYGKAVLNELNQLFHKKKLNIDLMTNKKKFNFDKIISLNLKNLNFRYENKEKQILKNLNLELKTNQFIGIRGETGAGKSTLVDIITGLLKPESGSFTINEKKFSSLPKNWHNNISYVPQNISLIDDTLERNIALGINDKHIDRNKIMEVIKLSKLNKFSQSSYIDSVLGENGLQVSGGEKQRIGIARALYYDRKIFIFDEATNALDENTEVGILENLRENLKDKIVIFISHKSTTLKFCDKIFNFSKGELKQI